MSNILLVIYFLLGITFFWLTFVKDKPSEKKLFRILSTVFVVLLPFVITSWIPAFNHALLFAIMAIGLNILLGNAGLISLGHAAFYALGAYATAILVVFLGIPIFIAILLGAIITAMLAFILGTPILRLKSHFLGIATLGLHVVIEEIIKVQLKEIFPAAQVVYKYSIGSISESLLYTLKEILGNIEYAFVVLGESKPFYFSFLESVASSLSIMTVFFATLIIITLLVYMARNILRTKIGRALSAIRDSEIAARALGVNLAVYKNIAFALSAFFAAVAGGIWALSIGQLGEENFTILISLLVLAQIVLGGLGSIQGAIIGAVIFKLLDIKIIKLFLGDSASAQAWSPFILGATVVAFIIFAPKGLVYMFYQLKLKIKQKRG